MRAATLRTIEDAREDLDQETLEDITDALDAAETDQLSGADGVRLQAIRDELERATLPLAAVLMDSVAKAALSGKRLEDV
jgi:hypothetical protein